MLLGILRTSKSVGVVESVDCQSATAFKRGVLRVLQALIGHNFARNVTSNSFGQRQIYVGLRSILNVREVLYRSVRIYECSQNSNYMMMMMMMILSSIVAKQLPM